MLRPWVGPVIAFSTSYLRGSEVECRDQATGFFQKGSFLLQSQQVCRLARSMSVARKLPLIMPMEDTILVTGGAGFIGSNFILQWMSEVGTPVINLDKLTYAGNLRNLEQISSERRYHFVQGDVISRELVRNLFQVHRPRAVLSLRAAA